MKKRGQITIFIIAGMIIVIALSIFLYIRYGREKVDVSIAYPEEVKDVAKWVEDCTYQTAKQGMRVMGIQSGFIYIPDIIANSPPASLAMPNKFNKDAQWSVFINGELQTGSDSVRPAFIKTPYWYYNGKIRYPEPDLMESDLSIYVTQNLPECINDFEPFKRQYEIKTGEITAEATIGDDQTVVLVTWPLDIIVKASDKRVEIDRFKANLDVKLGRIYRVARAILASQTTDLFFENMTINLMAANENVPFSNMEFVCGEKRWRVKEVKEEIQKTLYYNMRNTRVRGTKIRPFLRPEEYYENLRVLRDELWQKLEEGLEEINWEALEQNLNPPGDQWEYFQQYLDPGVELEELDIAVNFDYQPEFGLDLNVKPSRDGRMSSRIQKGISSYLSFICLNIYHFTYDVRYPVKVIVSDPDAFMEEGFEFTFAFPVTIKNNEGTLEPLTYEEFDVPIQDTGFCEAVGGPEVEIIVLGEDDGLINMEVDDVDIKMQCLNRKCLVGQTQQHAGEVKFKGQFPIGCSYPWVIAEKEGYLPAKKQLEGDSMEMEIIKLKEMDFSVVKNIYHQSDKKILAQESLDDDEKAMIMIKEKTTGKQDLYMFPYGEFSDKMTIPKIDSLYDVEISLIKTSGMDGSEQVVGGYKNQNLTIKYSDIEAGDEIVWHVFDYRPTPVKEADLIKMAQYMMNGEYLEALKPEII